MLRNRHSKNLQDIVKKDCMFATNTSSLSITEIGAGTGSSGYRYAFLQSGSGYEIDRSYPQVRIHQPRWLRKSLQSLKRSEKHR